MMEQISLENRYKEHRPQRSSNCQTKVLVGRDVFKELEQRRASPSVIAKLMGIDVLPPPNAAHNRHKKFKDVFEVSEEPQEAVRKGRQNHFPKGLKPTLKQSALKLKRLMPSKVLYRDDTHDSIVQCSGGLDHLNSVEINNPLFEKRPHDMNYAPNYQYEKDPARACRKYPLGLANSSLSDFRNLLRGEVEDFSNIVVLEPSMEKGHDPENIFSIPYLPPVKKNCQRGTKHKQNVFPTVGNGQGLQPNSGNEDVEPRIRKERCSTSDSIDPLLSGQEASHDHFRTSDLHYSESSQRYFTSNSNFRRNNESLSKMHDQYKESAGSKTLAEMFALSDSERLKLNSGSHAEIHLGKFDLNNGHSKEGCFIVLPKHAAPSSLQSIVDKDACLERPSKGRNNYLATSISYNNGNFRLDSFRDQTRLLKQTGNNREDNLRNASNFNCLMANNFSSPDCQIEKVLFTTDENIVRHHAYSKASSFDLQLARKQKATRLQFHSHEYESVSLLDPADGIKSHKGLKEVEQPSPVSILEPLTDEDSSGHFKYGLQEMAKKIKDRHQLHDEPEVTMSNDDDDRCDYQSLEAFQVEEDRDFSYLLDVLIGSGIIVADWQLLCKSWYSPGCPVRPHVFDQLERKYNNLSTWARPERKLLFDLVNSILSEVLSPCIDLHPWVPSRSQCAPLWGPEGPVEKVWQTIVKRREEFVTGYPDEMVLDPTWPDIGDDVSMVGKQIARMLHGDLMEEIIVEFLSGL